jgi:ADP-heptose:LPS heptosyltransferase
MKILLIQLRRLGDLILTTPAIIALRKHSPEAEIVLVVDRDCKSLLPAIPDIDQAIVIRHGLRDIAAWRQIRGAGCVVDFTRNDRSAWLTLLSGAPKRIVSSRLRQKSRIRARFYNEFVDCAMKHMHTTDYALALIRSLGISSADPHPTLVLPEYAERNAAALIATQVNDRPFAIFHPGSARAEKFWEADRWAEVMQFGERELGLRAVVTGGNSEIEQTHIGSIERLLPKPIVNLAGETDLLSLAALISRAHLLVTVDSAPMHLACAAKTPQIALFGPTNPFHWRPRSSPAAVLFGDFPEPLRDFQPRTPKLPMKKISTQAVINAMRLMQSAPAASAV